MYIYSIIYGTKQKESQKNNLWKNKPGFICFSLIMGAKFTKGIMSI